jgi:hypothetical protein
MSRLDAPGARSPVSTDRSFSTTRCVVLSMLCHTTTWPAGRVAGLGENDCAPLIATTLIVTTPLDVVGPGAAGLVVLPLEEPLPLQPHMPSPNVRTLAVANFRMTLSPFLQSFVFIWPPCPRRRSTLMLRPPQCARSSSCVGVRPRRFKPMRELLVGVQHGRPGAHRFWPTPRRSRAASR